MTSEAHKLSAEEEVTRVEYLKEAIERFEQHREAFIQELFARIDACILRINPSWRESIDIAKQEPRDRFNHRMHVFEESLEKPCAALQYDADVRADGDQIKKVEAAWEIEKKKLLKEYQDLLVINKEQNFHLQRGTHLRKNRHKPNEELNENKLNADINRLVKEIITIKESTKKVGDEVYDCKQQLREVKNKYEQQQKDLSQKEQEAKEKVESAEKEHKELYKEHMILQKLRLDLGDLLTSLRDQPNAHA